MNRLIEELASLVIEILRQRKRLRAVLVALAGIGFLLCLFFFLTASFWVHPIEQTIRDASPPLLAAFGFALAVLGISYTNIELSRDGVELELRSLREQRIQIQERLTASHQSEQPAKENVFDTIQLGLNQITEYYTINKSQARNSFRLSVFAMVVGLVTLIGGIWIFYFGENRDTTLAVVSGLAGVLVEFIGGAYFYLYNKSLGQLNFFYEKLVKMQDTMLAVHLSESLGPEKETEMKQRLIEQLMERSSNVVGDGSN